MLVKITSRNFSWSNFKWLTDWVTTVALWKIVLKNHWCIWSCSWSFKWLADHYSNESDRNEFFLENQIELVNLLKWIEDEDVFYLSNQWSVASYDSLDKKINVETEYKIHWISWIFESSCNILYKSWLSYSSHWTTELALSKDCWQFYKS